MGLEELLEKIRGLSSSASYKPHRYVLLLAVLELVDSQKADNRFYFNETLKAQFSKYLRIYGAEGDSDRLHTPFFHLRSSGLWYLQPKPGREDALSNLTSVGGPKEIAENVDFAFLSDEAYGLFANREAAAKIREQLVSILRTRGADRDSVEHGRTDGIIGSLFAHERNAIQDISDGVGAHAVCR